MVFGPEEWIALCNMTDTVLVIQLNAGNGTPQEAVDFICCCLDSGVANDDITIGNEVCMAEELVAGMCVTKTPEKYVDFYLKVCELMGEDIRQELADRGMPFGCIGIPMSHSLCKNRDWEDVVLEELNGKTDFIDIHIAYSPYYVSGNNNEKIVKCLLTSADRVRKRLDVEVKSLEKHAPDAKIALSEHFPLGAISYTSGMSGGMYLAVVLHVVLAEEQVISADYLPLTNHPAANNLLGRYNKLGENSSWDNVISIAFRMYAEQVGREVLDAQVTGAEIFAAPTVGLMTATRGVSGGDAVVYFNCVQRVLRYDGDGHLIITTKPVSLVRIDFIVPAIQ